MSRLISKKLHSKQPRRGSSASSFIETGGSEGLSQQATPEQIARKEIARYNAEDPEPLDNMKPLQWWKAREGLRPESERGGEGVEIHGGLFSLQNLFQTRLVKRWQYDKLLVYLLTRPSL